jgi:16S rRNA (cytosine967-C5)-methyltransferase
VTRNHRAGANAGDRPSYDDAAGASRRRGRTVPRESTNASVNRNESAAPARVAALRVYEAVEHGSATLPDALAAVQATLTDARDRALAAEIVSGTFRWRAALDHAIAAHASRGLDTLDPAILGILRLSAYQLLFLDRVPAHAVVFDAVALARTAKKQSAGGFVNAVLRKIAAVKDRASLWPPRSAPDYLTITLSHPRWLAERWVERHGFEAADAWARFNNAPAPLTLRANTLRITRDDLQQQLAALGVVTEMTTFATDGLIVREGNPLQTPLAAQGLFTTQDEASQLVASIAQAALPASHALRVLDACASPGGKTVALAAAVGASGVVVATDRRRRRIRLLAETVGAAGLTARVRIAQLDLTAPLPFPAVFDLVLVDAPCSGLGTIRREPEIRWRRTAEDLARFADQQHRMLAHAAAGVRPGGRLVYATCSSEPEENEAVAAAFLADHPEFRAVSARDLALPPALAPAINDAGHLRTYPFAHGLEAFFAAVFQRGGWGGGRVGG